MKTSRSQGWLGVAIPVASSVPASGPVGGAGHRDSPRPMAKVAIGGIDISDDTLDSESGPPTDGAPPHPGAPRLPPDP